jgi:hypothetical protein
MPPFQFLKILDCVAIVLCDSTSSIGDLPFAKLMADVQPRPDLLLPKSSPPSFPSPRPTLNPIISPPPQVSKGNIAQIVQYYLAEEYAWRATKCLPIEDHLRSRPDLHTPASAGTTPYSLAQLTTSFVCSKSPNGILDRIRLTLLPCPQRVLRVAPPRRLAHLLRLLRS